MKLIDAYPIVKTAVDANRTPELKERWRANSDLSLAYYLAPPIVLSKVAAGCLEGIVDKARGTNREITFYFTQRDLTIERLFIDQIGDYNRADYNLEGEACIDAQIFCAQNNGATFGIGHTHPFFVGPIFSSSRRSLNQNLGSDYAGYGAFKDFFPHVASDFYMLITPAVNLMGIFEVKEDGLLIYRPWVVKE